MDNLPDEWNCINCNKNFYVYDEAIGDDTSRLFFVCPDCKYEYISIECPKCGEADLKEDLESRPLSWSCQKCGAFMEVAPDYYDHPIQLYHLEELPQEIAEKIKKAKRKEWFWPKVSVVLFAISVLCLLFCWLEYKLGF